MKPRQGAAAAAVVALAGMAALAAGVDADSEKDRRPSGQASGTQDPTRPGLPAHDPRFFAIGSTACRICHRQIYTRWEATQHPRAASSLTFEQQVDPSCRPCHIPVPDFEEEGVACEACHGPGSAYAPLAVMIDPFKSASAGLRDPNDTCISCHNPDHPFHVERDLEAARRRVH